MQISRPTFLILLISFLVFSCQSPIDAPHENDEVLDDNSVVTVDGIQDGVQFFSIELPAVMTDRYELNETAILQYSDVHMEEKVEGKPEESVHYVLVLMEEKSEIRANYADRGLDLTAYHKLVISNFETVYGDTFEVLNTDSTVQDLNNLKYLETKANLISQEYIGDFKMYYRIVVLEGERAYYQLFTWCIDEQRTVYEAKMDAIISSFQETKADALN